MAKCFNTFKQGVIIRVIFLFVVSIVIGLSGCTSRKVGKVGACPQSDDVEKTRDSTATIDDHSLSKENKKKAEALALFAAGLISEISGSADALQLYLEAIKNDPTSPALYARIVSMYLKQNNPDAAIKTIKEGCERMPNNAELRMLLGHISSILGRVDEAEKAYREAIKITPEDTSKYLVFASFLKEKGKYEEAMKVLDEAMEKTKDTANILRLKGDMMLSRALGEKRALSKEDYQKITEYYEQALVFTNDASSPQYYERLGDIHVEFRNYEKALKAYQSALIRAPNDEQLLKKVAVCLVALGKRKEAADVLRKILKGDETDFNLLYYLGELYESIGDLNNAATCYDDAIKLAPSNAPSLYFKLAAIYSTTNINKAIEVLNEGVKALPHNYELVQTLATLYLQKREKQNALTLFETAERLMGESLQKPSVNFYMTYAFTALMNKDFDRALLNYEKAIELAPDNIDAYLMKAQVLVELNNYQRACSTLIEALAIQPTNPFVWFHYGILTVRLERFEEAVSIFMLVEKMVKTTGRKIEDMPFYDEFLFAYASSLERIKEYDKAEKMFLLLIERDPSDPDPFNYLAYTWAELDVNLEQALILVEHALEIEPDNGAFLDTLGWIYFKQNKFTLALDYLLQAAELAPQEPVIFEHIAEVYEKLNQHELAAQYLKVAEQKRSRQGLSTPIGYLLELMDNNALLEMLFKSMAGETNLFENVPQKAPSR